MSRVSERPALISSSVGGRPEVLNGDRPSAVDGTDLPSSGREPLTRADLLIVVGLVLVGVGMPIGLALWSHAFAIARYDDWAYRRVLMEFTRTGHITFVGWGAMTLVGQILWAAPFVFVLGAYPWVPGVTVAVASTIGLTSAYWLARSVVGRALGAACALLVLVLPGVLVNTSTFMTDMPAFSAAMLCLVLGAGALRRQGTSRWAFMAASVAVGCLGFAVREFDLAAPVAVLVALAAQDARQRQGRRWPVYFFAAVAALAICGVVYLWTGHLAHAQQETAELPTASAGRALGQAFFTVAFFLSPFLPAAMRRSWRTCSAIELVVAGVVLALGVAIFASGHGVFTGNYLAQQGMSTNASLPGSRPPLFVHPVWVSLELVGLGAGGVLAFVGTNAARGLLRSRSRAPVGEKTIVMLFTWLSGAGLVLYGLFVEAALFDRYLWGLAFGVAVLLVSFSAAPLPVTQAHRHPGPWWGWGWGWGWDARAGAAGLALVAIAVAVVITLNADAYDGARWAAGEQAVKAGYPASAVDAGFDWVGSHTAAPAVRGRRLVTVAPYETWYDQLFPGFTDCAFVSGSPLAEPHVAELGMVKYKELGFAVSERLYIYAVHSPQCAARRQPNPMSARGSQ
ncbi:MAG TPA: glycosyltransferase family 39 protein [Acidimicrobiales bacterium]|nr:glycosyltransferase family 39 protein [Acidimicrobiales bacterium]